MAAPAANGDVEDVRPSKMTSKEVSCSAIVALCGVIVLVANVVLYSKALERRDAATRLNAELRTNYTKELLDDSFGRSVFENIVFLETTYQSFSREMPWMVLSATFQGGLEAAATSQASGLIIDRNLILTAAYVAIDSLQVTAQRQGSGMKYPVTIKAVAPELGLALLQVDDESFWRMGEATFILPSNPSLPDLQSKVLVVGLRTETSAPVLHRLESRVSGLEPRQGGEPGRYAALPATMLSLYPAIGSSLSVGPVFSYEDKGDDEETQGGNATEGDKDGKTATPMPRMVGELIGFVAKDGSVVPAISVVNFVNAVKLYGSWPGAGTLGLVLRPMLPTDLREYWGLKNDDLGVQVRSVAPDSDFAAHGVQKGDVLVKLDGNPIRASGTILYNRTAEEYVLPFEVLLSMKMPYANSTYTFVRPIRKSLDDVDGALAYKEGSEYEVTVSLAKLNPLVSRVLDQAPLDVPPYFMVGGLVFSAFSEELVVQNAATKDLMIPSAVLAKASSRWRDNDTEQMVILLRSLEHPCNKFYVTSPVVHIVSHFNDQPIENMTELVKMVGNAVASNAPTLQFTFASLDDDDTAGGVGDPDIVLNTSLCAGADSDVMQSHGIAHPASQDIMDTYSISIPRVFYDRKAGKTNVRQRNGPKSPKVLPRDAPFLAPPEGGETKHEDGSDKQVQKEGDQMLTGKEAEELSGGAAPSAANAKGATKGGNGIKGLPWANVVQVQLVSSDRSFAVPWSTNELERSICSGIIVHVKAKLILTNSHCVGSAVSVDVLREDSPMPVPARVVEIAHDVDLAWITTESDAFWSSNLLQPMVDLEKGLPRLAGDVRVIGFPLGGSSVTITQGIVSRIDGQVYPNGFVPGARNTPDELLIVQVDAPINHGNSGGPAFDEDGNLIGLAFSGLQGANNVGYLIPNVYLKNFVQSVLLFGRWVAQPESGLIIRELQNEAMREFLRIPANETGVQVRSVSPLSPLAESVQKGDILVRLDGDQVRGDGKIAWDVHGKTVMLPYATKITTKAPGMKTKMDFLRIDQKTGDRNYFSTDFALGPIPPLVARFDDSPAPVQGREFFAANPTYFIVYGLVFTIFSNPLAEQYGFEDIPWTVKKAALKAWRRDDKSQIVVLLKVLSHPCNMHYDDGMRILSLVNGKPVNSMLDVLKQVGAFEKATGGNKDKYLRFTFAPLAHVDDAGNATDPDIVLSRAGCEGADKRLLASMAIQSRVSQDLMMPYMEIYEPEFMKMLTSKLKAAGISGPGGDGGQQGGDGGQQGGGVQQGDVPDDGGQQDGGGAQDSGPQDGGVPDGGEAPDGGGAAEGAEQGDGGASLQGASTKGSAPDQAEGASPAAEDGKAAAAEPASQAMKVSEKSAQAGTAKASKDAAAKAVASKAPATGDGASGLAPVVKVASDKSVAANGAGTSRLAPAVKAASEKGVHVKKVPEKAAGNDAKPIRAHKFDAASTATAKAAGAAGSRAQTTEKAEADGSASPVGVTKATAKVKRVAAGSSNIAKAAKESDGSTALADAAAPKSSSEREKTVQSREGSGAKPAATSEAEEGEHTHARKIHDHHAGKLVRASPPAGNAPRHRTTRRHTVRRQEEAKSKDADSQLLNALGDSTASLFGPKGLLGLADLERSQAAKLRAESVSNARRAALKRDLDMPVGRPSA